jgi:hypothetical protein
MKQIHSFAIWLILGLVCLLGLGSTIAAQGDYDLSWWTGDSGGVSSGGSYRVTGAVGQPDAGVLTNGNFTLSGGFLASGSDDSFSDRIFLPAIEH